MRSFDSFFIDGGWARPAGSAVLNVISPATEQVIGRAPEGTTADMDRAVAAARKAFDEGPWPRMTPAQRAAILRKIAEYLDANAREIAEVLTDEVGTPLTANVNNNQGASLLVRFYADMIEKEGVEEVRQGLFGPLTVRREPVGVVAAIVPWNGPFFLLLLKLAPALAAGCTVVAKPAPETPLDAYYLARAAEAAGLPPGVLNIVAAGREVGEYLVRHPGIDKVSFTGSTVAGRKIGAICGEHLKRVSLELGGKSAAVVLDDAKVETVLGCAIPFGIAANNGEACMAMTRILLPRSRYREFAEAITDTVASLKVGDPNDASVQIGPLISQRQRERVEGYIAIGRDAGARITVGGGRPKHLPRGWYVEPTIMADVDNNMRVAQEEIFGPVGVLIPYDGDEEAIRIANATEYGLGGAVFTQDQARGMKIARAVRTGTIGVNQYTLDFCAPFGGFKASGLGREMGVEGLRSYQEPKSIYAVDSAS
ncbi:MAG: aldehyde dehydrogenase [Steroidobacteraceae bacterium]